MPGAPRPTQGPPKALPRPLATCPPPPGPPCIDSSLHRFWRARRQRRQPENSLGIASAFSAYRLALASACTLLAITAPRMAWAALLLARLLFPAPLAVRTSPTSTCLVCTLGLSPSNCYLSHHDLAHLLSPVSPHFFGFVRCPAASSNWNVHLSALPICSGLRLRFLSSTTAPLAISGCSESISRNCTVMYNNATNRVGISN